LFLGETMKQAIINILLTFIFIFSGCTGVKEKAGNEIPQNIQNIEAFARLFGYVRYFYPGDEAANLDWDGFAIYGIKQVENAQSKEDLEKRLKNLFIPIAPALVIYDSQKHYNFTVDQLTPRIPTDRQELKVITWQHLGLGANHQDSLFKSIRLNRNDPKAFKNSSGFLLNTVDASLLNGKDIKLTAAVKVANGQGMLGLWAGNSGNQAELIIDMDENPIVSNQWKYYEVVGSLDANTQKLYFGCMLRGEGQLWADDFKLFARGKNKNSPWKTVKIANAGFEADSEKALPKNWIAKSKLYSYEVTGETASSGKHSISIKSKAAPEAAPLFSKKPAIGDHISKELGRGLSCLMPLALYGDPSRTYPIPDPTGLHLLQTAIKQEKHLHFGSNSFPGDDLYSRLAGIVITWNVFRHFYPYEDEVKPDWESALRSSLEASYHDRSHEEFLITLKKLTAFLHDGQGGAFLPGNYSRMYLPPVDWAWIQDRLIITHIFDNTIEDISSGDIVVDIEGKNTKTALEEIEKSISAATPGWKKFRALNELLRGKKNSPLHIKIKKDPQVAPYDKTLIRSVFSPKYYGFLEKQKPLSKKINNDIYYLNLDNTSMDKIKQLIPVLKNCRSIICDLRGAPKGSHLLIGHLIKEKKDADFIWIPKIIYPDYEKVTYKKLSLPMEPLEPFLSADMIFIVDNRTMDYAESILSYVEGYHLGRIVGTPTAGTNGNVNSFYLFGKYFIRWTGVKVVKHDGSPHHGIGFIPEVVVERTREGIKQGKDELLEKAIEIAKQRIQRK